MNTVDKKSAWEAFQKKQDQRYLEEVRKYDPEQIGLKIQCPDCHAISWIKFPEKRYAHNSTDITCPTGCGAYYPLSMFSPEAAGRDSVAHFDIVRTCPRDKLSFAVNGVIYRCPMCGIENPKEVMKELVTYVAQKLSQAITREELSDLLGKVVSTFDGVMRKSNSMARRNAEILGLTPIQEIRSFQNIVAAREKMLPRWDMATIVSDWNRYVLIFQKRHLFAHALGVVDENYLRKSGDPTAQIGKQVSLEKEEIMFLAENSEAIVKNYFGHFLS